MASPLALRFAQNVEKMDQLPAGAVPVAFPMPKGSGAEPELFTRILKGEALSQADSETAVTLAIQRNVLLAACEAVGAPGDMAKAEHILTNVSTAATPLSAKRYRRCWNTNRSSTAATSWMSRKSSPSCTSALRPS
jgi:hypothetical protein